MTLAGIMTLPLVVPNGAPFPARDVVIFIAMGVIVLSLVLATIALPFLTRDLHGLPDIAGGSGALQRSSEASARVAAAEAALRRIDHALAEPVANPAAGIARAEAALHLFESYRRRIDYGDAHEDPTAARAVADAERELRLHALTAERDELYRLRMDRGIDDDVHGRLMREIDLVEASLTTPSAH
jgi:CPA1 family monovalent cation:H+ antiporter